MGVTQILEEKKALLNQKHSFLNSYYVGIIIYSYNKETEKLDFLIIQQRDNNTSPVKNKFPGGCTSQEGETPLDILSQRLPEETGLSLKEGADLKMVKYMPLKSQNSPEVHHKMFVMVNIDQCEGQLNTERSKEASAPLWVSPDELVIFNGKYELYKTHKPPLRQVLESLMTHNDYGRSVSMKYYPVLQKLSA